MFLFLAIFENHVTAYTLSEKKDLVELVVRENGGGVETHAGSFGQRASRPSG